MEEAETLLLEYGLTEEICNRPISFSHLKDIASSCCGRRGALHAHLGLPSGLVKEIDSTLCSEISIKNGKKIKGSEATYKKLITAYLKIDCRHDADYTCGLIAPIVKQNLPSPVVGMSRKTLPKKSTSTSGLSFVRK